MSGHVFPDQFSLELNEFISGGGLTKRELFAAMVMQGLCSHPTRCYSNTYSGLAMEAVERTDALIKALEEKK